MQPLKGRGGVLNTRLEKVGETSAVVGSGRVLVAIPPSDPDFALKS